MAKLSIVNRNIADLWADPKFNSERASQLLFGEQVSLISKKTHFSKITQIDGYTGWVDNNFLSNSNSTLKSPNYIVTSKQAPTRSKSGHKTEPFFLIYGTRLYGRKISQNTILIKISDLAPFYVNSSNLKPINSIKRESVTPGMICNEAKRFLGIPYLWGGKSPLGFDCSGMIQAIFGRFGIVLPRDTKDQIKCGSGLPRNEVKRGDLLFFERHVALALDRTSFIHCSAGGGGVTINSLDSRSEDYRKDLDLGFLTARRVRC